MTSEKFICEICKTSFVDEQSTEEVMVVCDDCYHKLMARQCVALQKFDERNKK